MEFSLRVIFPESTFSRGENPKVNVSCQSKPFSWKFGPLGSCFTTSVNSTLSLSY